MKIKHILQFQSYRNFLGVQRKLKGLPYKLKIKTQKLVVSPVDNVIDYDGHPFTIGLNDKILQDFFLRLYTIEYETTLRILPA